VGEKVLNKKFFEYYEWLHNVQKPSKCNIVRT
jgi:hypothetical protein